MGSSLSTQQTNSRPLVNTLTKIENPKPIRVIPKFSLGDRVFTIPRDELYRDCPCKVIFQYVINNEVYKDIRGKVIKDILRGISPYTELVFKNIYYLLKKKIKTTGMYSKTALGELEKTIAIYKIK